MVVLFEDIWLNSAFTGYRKLNRNFSLRRGLSWISTTHRKIFSVRYSVSRGIWLRVRRALCTATIDLFCEQYISKAKKKLFILPCHVYYNSTTNGKFHCYCFIRAYLHSSYTYPLFTRLSLKLSYFPAPPFFILMKIKNVIPIKYHPQNASLKCLYGKEFAEILYQTKL